MVFRRGVTQGVDRRHQGVTGGFRMLQVTEDDSLRPRNGG